MLPFVQDEQTGQQLMGLLNDVVSSIKSMRESMETMAASLTEIKESVKKPAKKARKKKEEEIPPSLQPEVQAHVDARKEKEREQQEVSATEAAQAAMQEVQQSITPIPAPPQPTREPLPQVMALMENFIGKHAYEVYKEGADIFVDGKLVALPDFQRVMAAPGMTVAEKSKATGLPESIVACLMALQLMQRPAQ